MKIYSLTHEVTKSEFLVACCTSDADRNMLTEQKPEKLNELLQGSGYSDKDIFLYMDSEKVLTNGTMDNILLDDYPFNEYKLSLKYDSDLRFANKELLTDQEIERE